jgi:hemoglobin
MIRQKICQAIAIEALQEILQCKGQHTLQAARACHRTLRVGRCHALDKAVQLFELPHHGAHIDLLGRMGKPQTAAAPARRFYMTERLQPMRYLRHMVAGNGVASGNLVESFYGRIRTDDMLGPIFASRISDWPAHLDRMKAFWRSVLHNSGEFAGNPMLKHKLIKGIGSEHFSHWLELFYATLRELESPPQATQLVGDRARMIADSLLTGIEMEMQGLGGARAGKELPHV